MKHIEDYIKKSWEKIPKEFKERIKYEISVGIKKEKLSNGILFDEVEIDKKLQKVVDKVVVDALSKFYGFTEDEAHRLLNKI